MGDHDPATAGPHGTRAGFGSRNVFPKWTLTHRKITSRRRAPEVYPRGGHDGVDRLWRRSVLDLGKMVAFMAGRSRGVWDYEMLGRLVDGVTRGRHRADHPPYPQPAGYRVRSGAARRCWTQFENHVKKIIFHPKWLPSVRDLRPQLTVACPNISRRHRDLMPLPTAFEAFSRPAFSPMSQGIALEGMRLVMEKFICHAPMRTGTDIEARRS